MNILCVEHDQIRKGEQFHIAGCLLFLSHMQVHESWNHKATETGIDLPLGSRVEASSSDISFSSPQPLSPLNPPTPYLSEVERTLLVRFYCTYPRDLLSAAIFPTQLQLTQA